MRDDYARATAALRGLAEALRTCPESNDGARFSGYVIRLGRLLRQNAVVRASAQELEAHESDDDVVIAARAIDLTNNASALFERLATAVRPDGSLGRIVEARVRELGAVVARHSEPRTLGAMLQRSWNGLPVPFTLADLVLFNANVGKKLREVLFADVRGAERDELEALAQRFESDGEHGEELHDYTRIVRQMSATRILRSIRGFAENWESFLRGESVDAANLSTVSHDGTEHSIVFVVDLLVAQIEEGTARRYAIHRLRVFFESFECVELRQKLREAERRKRPLEAVLQAAMDRFLFLDGYYPCTHAGASRGYLDTLILERAEASGIPPLLVELKQVMAIDKRRQKSVRDGVVTAIATARGEVQRYLGHIATRPQWAGTLPVIVVVHSCIEDLSDLEAKDVVLIDLSSATPSRKRGRHP